MLVLLLFFSKSYSQVPIIKTKQKTPYARSQISFTNMILKKKKDIFILFNQYSSDKNNDDDDNESPIY